MTFKTMEGLKGIYDGKGLGYREHPQYAELVGTQGTTKEDYNFLGKASPYEVENRANMLEDKFQKYNKKPQDQLGLITQGTFAYDGEDIYGGKEDKSLYHLEDYVSMGEDSKKPKDTGMSRILGKLNRYGSIENVELCHDEDSVKARLDLKKGFEGYETVCLNVLDEDYLLKYSGLKDLACDTFNTNDSSDNPIITYLRDYLINIENEEDSDSLEYERFLNISQSTPNLEEAVGAFDFIHEVFVNKVKKSD